MSPDRVREMLALLRAVQFYHQLTALAVVEIGLANLEGIKGHLLSIADILERRLEVLKSEWESSYQTPVNIH